MSILAFALTFCLLQFAFLHICIHFHSLARLAEGHSMPSPVIYSDEISRVEAVDSCTLYE